MVQGRDEGDPNWRPHRPEPATPAVPIPNQMPTAIQLYPYHQQGFAHSPPRTNPPHPRHYRSMSNLTVPPPLPPKPVIYPIVDTNTSYSPPPPPPPPLLPSPPRLSSPPVPPKVQSPPIPPQLPSPPVPPILQSPPVPPQLPSPPVPPLQSPPVPPQLPSPPVPPLSSPPLVLPQDEVIAPTEDSDELAIVLALSQTESVQKKLREEELMNQEEADLARALAASMLPSESYFPSPNENAESSNALVNPWPQSSSSHKSLASPPVSLPVTPGGPSEESSDLSIPYNPYAEFGRYDKWHIPSPPEKRQEEAPKSLEPQPSSSFSSVSLLPYTQTIDSVNGDADESTNPFPETVLTFDNAAYTRQPGSDEERILNRSLSNEEGQQDGSVNQAKPSSTWYGKQNAEGSRPQLARVASQEEPYGRQYPQDARVSTNNTTPSPPVSTYNPAAPSTFSRPPASDYGFPSIGKANSYQPDIYQEKRKQSSSFSPMAYPSLGSRRGSASDTHSETSQSQTSSPPIPHNDKPHLHLDVPQRPATSEGRRRSTLPQPIATTSAVPQNQHPQTTGLLNVNHFVDQELLRGVSIGFKSPIISTRLSPMQEQMPNIISLPYTRCPPLHLQAPDWRHLLRLMARLSGTRIEPSVEATTVSKVELKLRTVIQFIKPQASSNDWRSVLWFTIEQPVPVASASRYTSGNPNLLPYSYTLAPIPAILRDASDSSISKTYTIPATDTIPLPTLPITFPDLALYLQAALDTSRRYLSDSPNGLGKLGKMVQTCYPNDNQDYSENEPERTRVSQYFKRVIGLSNKDKKKTKGTNNEDTYQLVTPFIPNEWG